MIADCRLPIEKLVLQLPLLSISPPQRVNRESAIPANLGKAMATQIAVKSRAFLFGYRVDNQQSPMVSRQSTAAAKEKKPGDRAQETKPRAASGQL